MSYQQNEYNQLCNERPCKYRGDLETKTVHHEATNCCKANDQVISAKFHCTLYNIMLQFNDTRCWLCKERKI